MKKPSEHTTEQAPEIDEQSELRAKIIGLGERSARKSYYPELRARLAELERFRAALDGSHDAILLVDLSRGRLHDANEAACRMLRLSRAELIGRPLAGIDPTFLASLSRLDAFAEEHREIVEATLRTGEGGELPVEVTFNLVRVGGDRYAIAVARDITERQRTQRALRLLAEAGATVSSSLDVAETIAHITRVALPDLGDVCAVYRRSSAGVIERLDMTHLVASGREAARALQERHQDAAPAEFGVARAITTGRAELVVEVKDAWLEGFAQGAFHLSALRALGLASLLVVPLVARKGAFGALVFGTALGSGRRYDSFDLELACQFAQRVAMALENARLYAEVQEASGLKEDFLTIVSHELRTPLTAILGWANMLAAGRLHEAAGRRAAAAIERNARDLGVIIEDLLDVSRMLANKFEIALSPTALAPIVEAAVDALRPAAAAKQLTLSASLASDLLPVLGHAPRLQQVVSNLIANAVKFTPAGGRVEVSLRERGTWAEIMVRDTGCGINPDFLPHLFQRFRQTQGVAGRGRAGLGLGLAIVRRIVELHHGEVRAESAGEGLGACFTVRLPLCQRGDVATLPPDTRTHTMTGCAYPRCQPALPIAKRTEVSAPSSRRTALYGVATSLHPAWEEGPLSQLHEPDRLRALHATAQLDTPAEPTFDRMTRLASRLLQAPIAMISLLDEERQFIKSAIGLPEPWASRRELPLSRSFCQYVVASAEAMIIADARQHPVLRGHKAISDPGFISYAGVPLITTEQQVVGAMCVVDTQARTWTGDELEILGDLSDTVVSLMSRRVDRGARK